MMRGCLILLSVVLLPVVKSNEPCLTRGILTQSSDCYGTTTIFSSQTWGLNETFDPLFVQTKNGTYPLLGPGVYFTEIPAIASTNPDVPFGQCESNCSQGPFSFWSFYDECQCYSYDPSSKEIANLTLFEDLRQGISEFVYLAEYPGFVVQGLPLPGPLSEWFFDCGTCTTCFEEVCNGDTKYCTLYECATQSECFCSSQLGENSENTPLNSTYLPNTSSRPSITLPLDPPCDVSISEKGSGVALAFRCETDQSIYITFQSFTATTTTNNGVGTLDIPQVTSPGTVRVYEIASEGNVLIYMADLAPRVTPIVIPCDDACYGCSRFITNTECRSTGRNVMILIIILLVLFGCCFLSGYWGSLLLGFWIVLLYLYFILVKIFQKGIALFCCMKRKVKQFGKDVYPEPDDEEKQTLVSSQETSDKPSKDNQLNQSSTSSSTSSTMTLPGTKRKSVAMMCICCLFFIDSSEAYVCAISNVVSSSISTCVIAVNNQSCLQNFQSVMTIPSTGSTSCIGMNTSGLTGTTIDVLRSTFLSLNVSFDLRLMYWSCDWIGVTSNGRSCYTPSNWCGGVCNNMVSTDATASGHLTGPATTLPGYTGCFRSCGCAGCDCFYCDQACSPYRGAAMPRGSPFQVFDVGSATFLPEFQFDMNNRTTGPVVITSALQEVGFPGLRVSVSAVDTPPVPNMNPYKLIKFANGSWYFAQATASGIFSPGVIGDVQGPDSRSFLVPNASSFIVGRNLMDFNLGSYVNAIYEQSAYSTIQFFALPWLVNGRRWEIVNNKLVTQVSSNFGAVISMSSENLPSSRIINPVCPELNYTSSGGCYQCSNNGSYIEFQAKSTCFNGSVSIISCSKITIPNPILELTTELKKFIIPTLASDSSGTCSITAIGYSSNATMTFDYRFFSESEWIARGNTSGGNVTTKIEGDGFDFSIDPKGFMFGTALRGFITVLVIMAICLAIGGGLYLGYRMYLAKEAKKAEPKSQ